MSKKHWTFKEFATDAGSSKFRQKGGVPPTADAAVPLRGGGALHHVRRAVLPHRVSAAPSCSGHSTLPQPLVFSRPENAPNSLLEGGVNPVDDAPQQHCWCRSPSAIFQIVSPLRKIVLSGTRPVQYLCVPCVLLPMTHHEGIAKKEQRAPSFFFF